MLTGHDSRTGPAARLYSIGHSDHDAARFLELLRGAGVTAVADVRSQPFSQRYPHYSRPELAPWLQAHDIAYAFLGDRLGGRPRFPSLYDDDGRVNYERVRRTAAFAEGLALLCGALEEHTVAMLCSEEDPLACHRGLMIAPALVERGLLPGHLRGDGRVESSRELEDRLLTETGVVSAAELHGGLFPPTDEERREWLAQAYRLQARRKAFRLRPEEQEE